MKRLPIVALVGLPILFIAACASPSQPVSENTYGRSVAPTHSSAPARACESAPHQGNTTVMVDWVDFVQLSGIQYIAGLGAQVPSVSSTQLGAVLGRVRCQLSALKFSEERGPNQDGDAAYLTVGTEVHAIHGFGPPAESPPASTAPIACTWPITMLAATPRRCPVLSRPRTKRERRATSAAKPAKNIARLSHRDR
jgi:hypothetical protein